MLAARSKGLASCADDEGEGREEEAEEGLEEGAQELQEGFLGEASVPLNAAQVRSAQVDVIQSCKSTGATSEALPVLSLALPGWSLVGHVPPRRPLQRCVREA